MSVIRIKWLEDSHDCDTCGPSYAEGAKVYLGEEFILDLEPHAHCFNDKNYSRTEVFRLILKELGYELAEDSEF